MPRSRRLIRPLMIINEKPQTVEELLKDLKLFSSRMFYSILVDGRSAKLSQMIHPKARVVIIPAVGGGSSYS